MRSITIVGGYGKNKVPETFGQVQLRSGEIWSIVGDTGSGKSRLIKDIEQLADGDSVTGRKILLNGVAVPRNQCQKTAARLVAHLGQNMRFVLDASVEEFLTLHARCRGRQITVETVLALVNDITPEAIMPTQSLNLLSGGQARALMIADVALICDSPVVLIDEIENAGVDKEKALQYLQRQDKLVLIVTHDPHTALMASKRIVMQKGAVVAVVERTSQEEKLYEHLNLAYRQQQTYQTLLRKGAHLI